ncbi:MAG: helix-turn-helix domain-containing protein [Phreatobacter sp.]|uniref:IclR family transcriptional regulator domain-containing protein n=1 Tax=Phreatobacter sp. TaxID=1966341 RepID=UPI001A383120|nr:IclR family transcriptional regulator C-terminal domain-containing protein [Phreatobacter sp.]MBL8569425.1 helix-turn-helix domain-containing protein [Phreatobacter sp.]
MPSFEPVIALSRGLEVLRVLNAERQSTVGSLHKATGLNKATIVRMLETLEHEGYVMRDADRAVYLPTGRCLLLSHGYDQHLWIGGVAEPIMHEFRKQIGWPSDIAIFDRDAMIVAQTTREPGSMLFSRRPGFRFPLLSTSMGRAYLAYCTPEQQERIIASLAAIPGKSTELARQPKKLAQLLAEVRENGYAVMDEAYSQHVFDGRVWAMGVPVREGDEVYASINIMMLHGVISLREAEKTFLKPLQATARRIAEALSDKFRATLWAPGGARAD